LSSNLTAYSVAVAASVFFLVLRYSLTPWLGDDTPLLIIVIAPIIASQFGTKPGLLATALCLAGSSYFLMEPVYQFQVNNFESDFRLTLFALVGIAISITGGVALRSKEALRISIQRQQVAVDAADLGVFEWNMKEDTTLWENDRMYEIFGHRRDEGSVNLQQFIDQYLYKEDLPEFEKSMQSALRSGGRFHANCRIIRKSDQQIRLVEFGGRMQYGPDNMPDRMIGVTKDITDQKSMEMEIDRTRKRLQAILDTVPGLIYQVDKKGNFEFVNRAYADLFGYEVNSLVGMNLRDLFPNEADSFMEHNSLVFLRGKATEFEERAMLKDGLHIYNSIKAPFFDDRGQKLSVLGISTDITERTRLANQLRESDARKDEFLAVLGHELRNPLAPLFAGVELLAQVKDKPEMIEKIQAMMQRQVAHLLRLVDDLLNMSRISRGLIELHNASVDINTVVLQALEQVEPVYLQRRIKVVNNCAPQELLVYADLDRLTQVVVNLLSNAAKFMDEEGTVTITTYQEDAYVFLKVRDTGYGIGAEHLDKIFSMFSQVPEHKRLTGAGGLGIGLALAQKLVEMQGGSICVKSEGEGKGSEFSIRLPAIL
jgi:PAS domain S-box-containing protein